MQGIGGTIAGSTSSLPNAVYQVIKQGSTYNAQNQIAVLGNYADVCTAIQACITAGSGNPITILVDPNADGEGLTLTINQPFVSITTDTVQNMDSGGAWWRSPRITTIVIDSTAKEIDETYIKGMCFRQLDFYANGHAISGVKIENCGIRPNGAAGGKGIRFLSANIIYYIRFTDCQMYDIYDQSTDHSGAISFQQTAGPGTGQIYFNNFIYKAGATNTTMMCVNTGCRFDEDLVFQECNFVNMGYTGQKKFYFPDGAHAAGSLKIINCTFEMHETETIFTMDAGHTSATHLLRCQFSGNFMTCGANGKTLTLINNQAVDGDWYTAGMGFINGMNNKIVSDTGQGTFTVGTTGAVAHFIFDVGYTYWIGQSETNVQATKG